ncbi:YtxH domain-containing protein [Arthrobacter zhaoguopingii]|uniref:YtxH domain-containing protein n=1 Tax=Arthrobacter zhaoguopingii TaxID=2681491 RepID=UPI00135A0BB4|nr:YtxH domain-containing protein [Arthrobacter zhaoguopingii]
MKNKLVFASGMAAGYVLGTRAGRESYEKIRTKANQLWNNPKIQSTVSSATDTVKDKAPAVQGKLTSVLKKRGNGSDSKDTPYSGTPVAVVPPPVTDEGLSGTGLDDLNSRPPLS